MECYDLDCMSTCICRVSYRIFGLGGETMWSCEEQGLYTILHEPFTYDVYVNQSTTSRIVFSLTMHKTWILTFTISLNFNKLFVNIPLYCMVKKCYSHTCTATFRSDDGTLSMQLVGKDFHVTFFRHKKQQIYRWKGKEKEKFVLLHAFR